MIVLAAFNGNAGRIRIKLEMIGGPAPEPRALVKVEAGGFLGRVGRAYDERRCILPL